jgi:hypothetical protein
MSHEVRCQWCGHRLTRNPEASDGACPRCLLARRQRMALEYLSPQRRRGVTRGPRFSPRPETHEKKESKTWRK